MRDFSAIFRRAKLEASKNRGDTGSSGDKMEEAISFNGLRDGSAVTTAESPVVTVVTTDRPAASGPGFVTTVTTANKRVVTGEGVEKPVEIHRFSSPVTTGTTVTTKNGDVLKKSGSEAMRRAELRNSMSVYEPQADRNRCHVCVEREAADRPLIPIMTPVRGDHHWLHSECWPEHVRRVAERVDGLMRDAGYSAEQKEEEHD